MTKKTLRVTQAQVAAARLRLKLDTEAGRIPSRAMQRIAAAVLPSDGPELPTNGGSGVPEPSDGSPPVGTMGYGQGNPARRAAGDQQIEQSRDIVLNPHRLQPLLDAQVDNPLAPYLSGLLGAERVEQIQHGQDVVLDPDLYRRLSSPQVTNPVAPVIASMLDPQQHQQIEQGRDIVLHPHRLQPLLDAQVDNPLAPYLSGLFGAERVEQIQHGQDVVLDPDLYRRLSPKGTQGELSSGDDDGLSISP